MIPARDNSDDILNKQHKTVLKLDKTKYDAFKKDLKDLIMSFPEGKDCYPQLSSGIQENVFKYFFSKTQTGLKIWILENPSIKNKKKILKTLSMIPQGSDSLYTINSILQKCKLKIISN